MYGRIATGRAAYGFWRAIAAAAGGVVVAVFVHHRKMQGSQ